MSFPLGKYHYPSLDLNNTNASNENLKSRTTLSETYKIKVDVPPILLAPKQNNYFPSGFVHCVVVRDVNDESSKTHGRYNFIYQTSTNGMDKISMVALRQKGNLTSNFHLFDLSRTGSSSVSSSLDLNKKSGNYIGKLRRLKHERTVYSLYNAKEEKEQIGAFIYDIPSVLKQIKEGQPPRKLKIAIPHIGKDGDIEPLAPYLKNRMIDSLINTNKTGLHTFETKVPSFEHGQYRLNFGGRVSVPSVKNLQMINDNGEVILQFGKVGGNRFHLDYK